MAAAQTKGHEEDRHAGMQGKKIEKKEKKKEKRKVRVCLLYTSPSPRDGLLSRMPSSA